MKIALVFPYNNPCTVNNPKPVALVALSYIQNTKYSITIITPATSTPFIHKKHQVVTINAVSESQYVHKVITILDNSYDIVEVHQATKLAGRIAKKYPHIKVSLIKHGFYLINRIKERFFLFRLFYYHFYLKYIYRVFVLVNMYAMF